MKDYYAILGIEPGASQKEIREAYLLRVRVVHPDRFDQKTQPVEWQQANEMMAEINEAYSRLKDSAGDDISGTGEERSDVEKSAAYEEPYNYFSLTDGVTTFRDLTQETRDLLVKEINTDKGSWHAIKTGSIFWNYFLLIASIGWLVLLFLYPKTRLGHENGFVLVTLVSSLIAAYNLDKIYGWLFSSLNSYFVLTPLYFININSDIINYIPLWLLKDVKVTHHFKGSSHTGSTVKLIYEKKQDKIYFGSKHELEEFSIRYDKYINNLRYESRHGNVSFFQKEDIFADVHGKSIKRSYWGRIILYAAATFLGINLFFLTAPDPDNNFNSWPYTSYSQNINLSAMPAEKPFPPNGWSREFSRLPDIAPLTIETPPDEMNYLVKVCDWKTDRDIKIVFVRAGDAVETKIPLGTYRLKFAYGSKWYGERYAFGNPRLECVEKKLDCTQTDNVVTGYIVHLDNLPPYGNLETREIGREEF